MNSDSTLADGIGHSTHYCVSPLGAVTLQNGVVEVSISNTRGVGETPQGYPRENAEWKTFG